MRCIENNYLDIGHNPGPHGVLLWTHNGNKVEIREERWQQNHFAWGASYDGWGRVDTVENIGSITFDFTTSQAEHELGVTLFHDAKYNEQRLKARKVVRDVVEAFPGVKFRVFCGDGNTTVQKFWEDTE